MSSNTFKRIKKNGGIEGLAKIIRKPGTVDVGIIDAGQHDNSDLTVASIGFVHEFGSEKAGIPERSFMRSTLVERRKDIIALQKKLLAKVVGGKMEQDQALGLIGEFVADAVQQKITAIQTPPNTPATIEKKGSSNPLIDHRQLLNSITHKVNS